MSPVVWRLLKKNSKNILRLRARSIKVNTGWNYSTVIIKGVAKIIEDQSWLLDSVMKLSDLFEKDDSWKKSVDQSHLSHLSKAIVGMEISIEEMQGKFKLSDNRTDEDRRNFIRHLEKINPTLAKDMQF